MFIFHPPNFTPIFIFLIFDGNEEDFIIKFRCALKINYQWLFYNVLNDLVVHGVDLLLTFSFIFSKYFTTEVTSLIKICEF